MSKRYAVLLIPVLLLGLTGCGDPEPVMGPSERFQYCIDHGGNWEKGGVNDEKCTLPDKQTGEVITDGDG